MPKYRQETDGEWIRPVAKGYKMACCDCGLVHRLDFRVMRGVNATHGRLVKGARAEFMAFRDNRATAAVRRHMRKDKS